jgi:5-methylcytosine-specific restriction enzyme A
MPGAPQAERQRKQRLDRNRPSSPRRGYDAAWRRARDAQRAREPLCRMCLAEGRVTEASVVDHIISVQERPDLRLEPSNLRSLCKAHHDWRTAGDHGFNKRKAQNKLVVRSGCDARGRPLGDHPWNR